MSSGVLLNMAVVSPALSALQALVSSAIVGHLRETLPALREDFLAYYQGTAQGPLCNGYHDAQW
jgi:hypothetical protein